MRLRIIRVIILMIVLLTIQLRNILSQDTERPLPPVLELVTVNPSNGRTAISWSPGGSPDVAGYVFYIFRDGAGEAFDTLYLPYATTYTDITSNAGLFSVTYLVAAIDSSDNISPLSNPLSTIFIESELDTCRHGIIISWTPYKDDNHAVDFYELNYSEDGSGFTVYESTQSDDTSLFIPGVITDVEYCFTVRASINGDRISSSNKTCTVAGLETPPAWINGNYATVEGSDLLLSFSFDQGSEISRFRIYESLTATDGYKPADDILSSSGTVEYRISPAPAVRKFYILAAINSCDQPVIFSNIVSLLTTSIQSNDNTVFLTWDSYVEWTGGVDHYSVYRREQEQFNEIGQTLPGDTVWTDNISSYMYEATGDSVCYFVSAFEGTNPYFQGAESRSAITCIGAPVKIFVPTAFTPGDNGKNDHFVPVISFTPEKYHLIIRNRSGATLFETRSPYESWDGYYRGARLPEDVYFWFLELVPPGGETISRHGSVTIIIN